MEATHSIQESDSSLEKYTVFELAGQKFALEIHTIKEVLPLPNLTQVPNSENYVGGIFNYRGKIITVLDLSLLFKLEQSVETDKKNVIVLEIDNEQIGFIVNDLHDFLHITPDQIKTDFSQINPSMHTYARGIVKNAIVLLDSVKLLKNREIVHTTSA